MAKDSWGSPIEFIFTVISFAVGLGSVWRFPYLVFTNGGAVFVVIFVLILIVVGIPMFLLELSIGQFSGLGPGVIFHKIAPIAQGLGIAGVTISAFIGFYYNTIVAYCLYYFIMSIRAELPWASCNNKWNTKYCAIRNESYTCEQFNEENPNPKSPSEEYFYNQVLSLSNSIGNLGKIEYQVALPLFGVWLIVFLALIKGIKSLGKISYFTSTFPYLMLTILIITGSLLDGAGEGVKYYIGTIDTSKFASAAVWKDATVQVFYVLGTCSGGLIAMSSFNRFKNNILRDSFLIPVVTCFTGLFAGFAIFTVLGYMYKTKCASEFSKVVAAGPELTFIVFPEGLSLIKAVPPLWSCLFFIMMLALGFGSEFSFMETTIIMILDLAHGVINTKWKIIGLRVAVCLTFFLCSLTMATQGGFFVLTLINEYIAGYPLLIVGLLQCIIVPWVYGTGRLIEDIESMIGPKPMWFWWIFVILWRFVCPLVILAVTIATAVLGGNELAVNGIVFPSWAHGIGYVIVAVPLSIIVICALIQIYLYRNNLIALFRPDEAYFLNQRKNNEENSNQNVTEVDMQEMHNRKGPSNQKIYPELNHQTSNPPSYSDAVPRNENIYPNIENMKTKSSYNNEAFNNEETV